MHPILDNLKDAIEKEKHLAQFCNTSDENEQKRNHPGLDDDVSKMDFNNLVSSKSVSTKLCPNNSRSIEKYFKKRSSAPKEDTNKKRKKENSNKNKKTLLPKT